MSLCIRPRVAVIDLSTWGLEKQIYVHELGKGITAKITSEEKAHTATWTPDGRRVVFSWWRAVPQDIAVAETAPTDGKFPNPIPGSAVAIPGLLLLGLGRQCRLCRSIPPVSVSDVVL